MTTKTKTLRCEALLTRQGWRSDVLIKLDANGIILSITDAKASGSAHSGDGQGASEAVKGALIPGFQNAHSHAFQYAMAGLAEHLPADAKVDDFWSWRDTMYKLAGTIAPQQQEDIAAMLYAEMLRHGYTSVVEFHYLHHDRNGQPFAQRSEMSERLMAAAQRVGIELTLIPIFYQRGGFGIPAKPEQKRFLSKNAADYGELLASVRQAAMTYRDVRVGIGFHSLRAVETEALLAVLAANEGTPAHGPVHIHVSEQRQEVEQAVAYLKKRPIEWLLDNVDIDGRFNLVHATHMTSIETSRLATSGANVVLCPSTEGNLGDGLFPLQDFLFQGGQIAIGTDSHIGLGPFEELRWLDYGQRLRSEKRNTLCQQSGDDSGRIIFDKIWSGGRSAVTGQTQDGRIQYFAPGQSLDAVCLKLDHPLLIGKPQSSWLAATIYGGDSSLIEGTLRRGEWLVHHGRHLQQETIVQNYRRTMSDLVASS